MKVGRKSAIAFAAGIDFEKQGGLVPAIAQAPDNRVLMLAYMNRNALAKTLTSGNMWYYSRSRKRLWRKGEKSGNTQKLLGFAKDCDSDALLFTVKQKGPACHTGNKTCFALDGCNSSSFSLGELFSLIEERKRSGDKNSYTRKLLADKNLLSSKIYEEAAELVEAFNEKPKDEVVWETSDLVYHLMVLLAARGISLRDVEQELGSRRKGK